MPPPLIRVEGQILTKSLPPSERFYFWFKDIIFENLRNSFQPFFPYPFIIAKHECIAPPPSTLGGGRVHEIHETTKPEI